MLLFEKENKVLNHFDVAKMWTSMYTSSVNLK